MYLVKETDCYRREREEQFSSEETITLRNPEVVYKKESYDWQIIVALEKIDLIKEDRHLITSDLILSYRWAIREGFGHMLDPHLKNQYDRPRNRNTIKGVQSYINRIEDKQKSKE